MSTPRCPWLPTNDPLYEQYHDTEWGVPVYDDQKIFEYLVLESAQAGLSWITILRKREGYRQAFSNFDPVAVSKFTERNIENLLQNPAIVRNRAKIAATINNAQRFLEVQREFGTFSSYMWGFVQDTPIQGTNRTLDNYKTTSDEAIDFAKDLKKRGFAFLGPTTVYAHMQAVGMINDHVVTCFRHAEISRIASERILP